MLLQAVGSRPREDTCVRSRVCARWLSLFWLACVEQAAALQVINREACSLATAAGSEDMLSESRKAFLTF